MTSDGRAVVELEQVIGSLVGHAHMYGNGTVDRRAVVDVRYRQGVDHGADGDIGDGDHGGIGASVSGVSGPDGVEVVPEVG